MQYFLTHFAVRWLVSALGLWVAASLLGPDRLSVGEGLGTVVGAGFFLALVNMALKPILVILSFPAIIFSLGLFMLALNGFLILIASWLYSPLYVKNFGMAVVLVSSWGWLTFW
ncbi:phage holin family protein [Candidatus Saccharibacteria bacterium]|nr:phage holin family protein [Candidatus Saccharibacteria bacterium]